jgi:hypothetical protein
VGKDLTGETNHDAGAESDQRLPDTAEEADEPDDDSRLPTSDWEVQQRKSARVGPSSSKRASAPRPRCGSCCRLCTAVIPFSSSSRCRQRRRTRSRLCARQRTRHLPRDANHSRATALILRFPSDRDDEVTNLLGPAFSQIERDPDRWMT